MPTVASSPSERAEAGTASPLDFVLGTTFNHPFHVIGKGWTAAGNLEIGDRLRTDDGSTATVTDLFPNGDVVPVFNLSVAGNHTYFVGGRDGQFVLVHNQSPEAKTGGYPGGWWNPGNWWRGLYTGDPNAPDRVYQDALEGGGQEYSRNAGTAHQALRSRGAAGPAGSLGVGVSAFLEMLEGPELHNEAMQRANEADPGNPTRQVNEFVRDHGATILRVAKIIDYFNSARDFKEFAEKLAKDKVGELANEAVDQGLDHLQQVGINGRIKEIDAELETLDPEGSSKDLARQNDLLQEKFALTFGGQAFDLAKGGDAGREKALNTAVGTARNELKRLQQLDGEITKRLKDPAAAGDAALLGLQVNVQNDMKLMAGLVAAGQKAQDGRAAVEFGMAGAALVAGIIADSSENNGGPYGHLEDGTKVEAGRPFQPRQKERILDENRKNNGGRLMSDDPNDPWFGQELIAPPRGRQVPGEFPEVPDNQAQIDHIVPKIGPDGKPLGTNAYSNARVISAEYNRMKSNKLDVRPGD